MDLRSGRIIDANINRVSEGLRVVEDVFRYGHENIPIQKELKSLRHSFSACFKRERYIPLRDSIKDPGFKSKGELENKRSSAFDLVKANIKRAEEGLRVLEEVLKLEKNDLPGKMKRFRYDLYEIEKNIFAVMKEKKISKGLYLIISEPAAGYEEIASMAVDAGVSAIQLNPPALNDRDSLKLTTKIKKITQGTKTLFIIKSRIDVAIMSHADGVYLEKESADPEGARKALGNNFIIIAAAHKLSDIKELNNKPVDYVRFGPLWSEAVSATTEKGLGLEKLNKAIGLSISPVIAYGGISLGRVKEVPENCSIIAVKKNICGLENPQEEIKEYNRMVMETR